MKLKLLAQSNSNCCTCSRKEAHGLAITSVHLLFQVSLDWQSKMKMIFSVKYLLLTLQLSNTQPENYHSDVFFLVPRSLRSSCGFPHVLYLSWYSQGTSTFFLRQFCPLRTAFWSKLNMTTEAWKHKKTPNKKTLILKYASIICDLIIVPCVLIISLKFELLAEKLCNMWLVILNLSACWKELK